MRSLFCLLALATLLHGQEQTTARPAAVSAAEKARLAALLPDAAPAHFYSADLYEYIDGGAEAYHQYGMVAMAHQEYRSGATDVTADIYDMGDPLRAFGIYAAERSPSYGFIRMGAEGYRNEGLLNFLQGNYYVKLLGFADAGKPDAVLDAAARAISAKIGGGRILPQAISWFPARGLVERSQKYILKEPLGHEFLAPAATAVYRLDGQETTLLVSLAPNPADVVAHLKRSYPAQPVAGLPFEAWRGANPYEGEVVFFTHGRYTIVVMHPPAQPQAFLKELVEAVK